jgi:uncharacterized protein YukE
MNFGSAIGIEPPVMGNRLAPELNRLASAGDRLVSAWNRLASAGDRLVSAWNRLASAGDRLVSAWNRLASAGDRLAARRKRICSRLQSHARHADNLATLYILEAIDDELAQQH